MSTAIGLIASTISIFAYVPQTIRAFKVGIEGISVVTYQLVICALSFWFVYDGHNEYWSAFPGMIGMFVCCTAILVRIYIIEKRFMNAFSIYVCGVVGAAITVLTGQYEAAGVIAVVVTSVICLPQLRDVFIRSDVNGVSITTWVVNSSVSLLWIFFAILESDWVIFMANVATFVASMAIWLETWRRRRRIYLSEALNNQEILAPET